MNGEGAEGTAAESEQLLSQGDERSNPEAEGTDTQEDSSSDEAQIAAAEEVILAAAATRASHKYSLADAALSHWAGTSWQDIANENPAIAGWQKAVEWLSEAAPDAIVKYIDDVAYGIRKG